MNYSTVSSAVFAFAWLLGISCAKDNFERNASYEAQIKGTWELRKKAGGMMVGEQLYAPGNGNILQFGDSNRYQIYADGVLQKRGKFEIVYDDAAEKSLCLVLPAGQFNSRLRYDRDDNKLFIRLKPNELFIISGCYSRDTGKSALYERQ